MRTGSQTPIHTDETTDESMISIILIDPTNDSNRIPLNSTDSMFQPGQEDRFDLTLSPMGEVIDLISVFSFISLRNHRLDQSRTNLFQWNVSMVL